MVEYDKENMLGVLEAFSEQCKDAVKLARGVKISGKIKNIVVCGMGGSGIGGELLTKFSNHIPITAHHDYGLPKNVDKNTLVIVTSYSGNTEETLSCYDEAKKKKTKILSITSGGKLAEKDKKAVIVPSGYQPRAAIGYIFLLPLAILSNNRLVPNQGSAISEAIRHLDPRQSGKEAFMLAKKIKDKIPVFYSSNELTAVAYSMKTHVNENAKQPAFSNVIPEMNHNEILGYKKLGSRLIAIFLESKKDNKAIKKRMMISKKLIKEDADVTEINVRGKSLLARVLTTLYIGDLASYYLALMNKVDPTPIETINRLKKRLKE
jgi:glucose/mannose-6-phosphate isomerase